MFDPSTIQSYLPISKWINEWKDRPASISYRGEMASQIFIIRKVHGYSVAKSYALYIRDLGHYPTELPRNLT
jgi:hypothetical protein